MPQSSEKATRWYYACFQWTFHLMFIFYFVFVSVLMLFNRYQWLLRVYVPRVDFFASSDVTKLFLVFELPFIGVIAKRNRDFVKCEGIVRKTIEQMNYSTEQLLKLPRKRNIKYRARKMSPTNGSKRPFSFYMKRRTESREWSSWRFEESIALVFSSLLKLKKIMISQQLLPPP